jgi:hypothetical protein
MSEQSWHWHALLRFLAVGAQRTLNMVAARTQRRLDLLQLSSVTGVEVNGRYRRWKAGDATYAIELVQSKSRRISIYTDRAHPVQIKENRRPSRAI